MDGSGLSLRIKPNGTKSWLFNYYRPYSKKRSNLSLGTYPQVTLAEAREHREHARALLAKNIDPKEHKEEQATKHQTALTNTLEKIAADWFSVKRSHVTPNYADDIWASFELHIFPELGKFPLKKLTAKKVIDTLKPIAAKGNFETIKRLCQRLNEVMVYANNAGLIDNNPLAGIKSAFQSPSKNNMPTIKPEQLPELVERINSASIKTTTRNLILWQLHTMTRPSEAAGARRAEIDFDAAPWVIPEERIKKRRKHQVPLSPQALQILDNMRPISSHREHIFPADRSPRKQHQRANRQHGVKAHGVWGCVSGAWIKGAGQHHVKRARLRP